MRLSWEADDEAAWPESESKEWEDLSAAEQAAAATLGYTSDSWDFLVCE